jgi:hypothetical protein
MKRVKEGELWLRYFLYMYKHGTLKPVEIILRRQVGGRRIMEEMN